MLIAKPSWSTLGVVSELKGLDWNEQPALFKQVVENARLWRRELGEPKIKKS
jgi:hypothetical protein